MHPLKQDTPVATAVLEITLSSGRFGTELTQKQLNFVLSKCDPDCSFGRITVVSYERSDTYAMQ